MIPIEVLVGVILAIQKTYGDEEHEDEDKADKKIELWYILTYKGMMSLVIKVIF